MSNVIPIACLLGIIGITVWYNQPAATINGEHEVKATPAFHASWKANQQTDATIIVKDKKSGATLWSGHLDNERLYASPETLSGSTLEVSTTNDHYFGQTVNDIGFWTGYCKFDPHHWQSGLLYSPCRICYDTLAPDIRASQWAAGVGLTFYAPTGYLPPIFNQAGISAFYMAPFNGRSPGLGYGFTFTAHH